MLPFHFIKSVRYLTIKSEYVLGTSLVETGEGYKQLADIKYSLEDNVKQNFIEPLNHLQSKDLKEVNVSNLQGSRSVF